MGLTDAYVQGTGKLPELFVKIRDGQAPNQFTTQLLKDWGFTSTNDRLFVPLLKALGFLSPEGKPTPRYHAYRDHSRSKAVMAEALREAYQDLFLIKANPTKDDRDAIQGKFRSSHNATDRVSQLMAATFLALLPLADLSKTDRGSQKEQEPPKVDLAKPEAAAEQRAQALGIPTLHYNIQIHLPASKDVGVYNAIFKSLKEHLFEI